MQFVFAISRKNMLHLEGSAFQTLFSSKDFLVCFTNLCSNDVRTSAKESLGLHELKQNKPWFDEECLGFLDQRKRAKMQWMQDPSQSNVDILNNVRREVSRHFRGKKRNNI